MVVIEVNVSCIIQFSVPSMPPEDVRCAALSSQSLQITWQPPPTEHCNGLLQGYKLTYEPVMDDDWRGTQVNSPITKNQLFIL